MRIIQTYFNDKVNSDNINIRAKFHSTEIHWLSVAYSCLLLKQQNPDMPLILYGNTPMLKLLMDDFGLPYDNGVSIEVRNDDRKIFYCWPKIETYKQQHEPFVHIDNDVFMWQPIPLKLKQANLIAQHQEQDSTFYMRIFNHMKDCGIQLPNLFDHCITPNYIKAYNAGLLGGNNLDFFGEYLWQIDNFLNINISKIKKSTQQFLFNVVFEQWLYYALSKELEETVSTYYNQTIIDFKMPNNGVPCQVLDGKQTGYIHLMDYKQQYSSNRFVAKNMIEEFPEYYERILSVCEKKGVKLKLKYFLNKKYKIDNVENTNFTFSKCEKYINEKHLDLKIKDLFLKNRASLPSDLIRLYDYELVASKLFEDSEKNIQEITECQFQQKRILDQIASGAISMDNCIITLSPYAKILKLDESYRNLILSSKIENVLPKEMVTVFVYNVLFRKVDEFIYGNLDSKLIQRFQSPTRLADLSDIADINKKYRFIKQGIFDNILYCKVL